VIEELQQHLEVIKADVDSLNQDKLSSQRIFYELKDKVITKSSRNDADIVFGLAPKVLSPMLLEAGDISGLEANIERATNLSAFLLQRMELQRKHSALLLKREEETEQRASLKEVADGIKRYEQALLLLDQTCAEAEKDWNAVFKQNIDQSERGPLSQQEHQRQEDWWEDQPAPQYDDQFVKNLFEVVGS
jgi:hypothetical protein